MSNGAVAAAAVAAKRKRIVQAFREGAALSRDSARPLGELGLSRSMMLGRLLDRGVLVEVAQDRFFLDEAIETADRRQRQTRFFWVLAFIVAALAVLLLAR